MSGLELVCARTAESGGSSSPRRPALYRWDDAVNQAHGVIAANETQARALVIATLVLPGLFMFDSYNEEDRASEVDLLVKFVQRDAAASETVLRRASVSYMYSRDIGFALRVCREPPAITETPLGLAFKAERNGCVVIGGTTRSGTSYWQRDAAAEASAAPSCAAREWCDSECDAKCDAECDTKCDAECDAACERSARSCRQQQAPSSPRQAASAPASAPGPAPTVATLAAAAVPADAPPAVARGGGGS